MGNKQALQAGNLPELPPQLQAKLENTFVRLDIDGNGKIERREVMKKFESDPRSGQKVAKFFSSMSQDQVGVDKEEYFLYWRAQFAKEGGAGDQMIQAIDNLLEWLDKAEGGQSQSEYQKDPQTARTPTQAALLLQQSQQARQKRKAERAARAAEKRQKLVDELKADLDVKMELERTMLQAQREQAKELQYQEKEALAELEEVDMQSARQSTRLSASLIIENEAEDGTARTKIEKIDEQVMNLQLEVALLEAANNRFEYEMLNFGDDEAANENLKSCIAAMAQLKSLDTKLSQATEVFEQDIQLLV